LHFPQLAANSIELPFSRGVLQNTNDNYDSRQPGNNLGRFRESAGMAFFGTLALFLSLPLSTFAYNLTDQPNYNDFASVVSYLSWGLAFLMIAQGLLLLLRGQWLWESCSIV
jgi:hypothetical protein